MQGGALLKDAPKHYAADLLDSLIVPAKITAGLLKKCAFNSLNANEVATDCRIGNSVWSGFTCAMDSTVKPHKDSNNLPTGCTAILNLINQEKRETPAHVLCNYAKDENGKPGIGLKLENGSILFKVARKEVHASTKVSNPNPRDPSRIGLIFSSISKWIVHNMAKTCKNESKPPLEVHLWHSRK